VGSPRYGTRQPHTVTHVSESPRVAETGEEERYCCPFRVALRGGRAYWTVVDGNYAKVTVADEFLFEVRFGCDRAESTSRVSSPPS
jgi:hypothetical protein